MADNYLEKHREEYEKRKAEWIQRKKLKKTTIKKPFKQNEHHSTKSE